MRKRGFECRSRDKKATTASTCTVEWSATMILLVMSVVIVQCIVYSWYIVNERVSVLDN